MLADLFQPMHLLEIFIVALFFFGPRGSLNCAKASEKEFEDSGPP